MEEPNAALVSDTTLVIAYLTGDADALASIYDRYADRLFDVSVAMLRDRNEAADVVQDTFLVAAERMVQLRNPARLKAWLFAITRHEVYRRSKQRSRMIPSDFTLARTVEPMAPASDWNRSCYGRQTIQPD